MATRRSRSEKVKRIFQQFDFNRDGGLNREEMIAFVEAVNPRVKFSDDQLHAIVNEVYETYGEFIDGEKGLTYDGLLRTYDDGAGDVHRDFAALGLELKRDNAWAASVNPDGILFNNTRKIVDDLEILINRLKAPFKKKKINRLKATHGKLEGKNADVNSDKRVFWEESGHDYALFVKELGGLRSRADDDGARSREEAFDWHMAMGIVLYEHQLDEEALVSLKRACELQPTDLRPHFGAGSCWNALGSHSEAKEEFFLALEVAGVGGNQWSYLLPQIHVSLGMALEGEGHKTETMPALENTENPIASGVIEFAASCRCFSLVEIRSATRNFNDAFVIGIGGFGKVYKGFIIHGGGAIVIAVKRLNSESKQGAKEFSAEIKMLSNLRHPNLVSLIGYCTDCDEMILVYEYIARGTLADHLYKRRQGENSASSSHLSWEKRLEICISAARGLDYIHTGTDQSFIHRDVKTTNILLDESWVVKISDFGLSKGTTSHSITHLTTDVKGTFGYLDPDYFLTQRLTTKSDVYAFGVVLLEVLCGRPPVDTRLEDEKISLVNWAQQCIKKGKLNGVIDPSLSGQISSRCLNDFVKIANNCLQKGPKARPKMAEVMESLELALALQRKVRTKGIMTKAFQGISLVPKGWIIG